MATGYIGNASGSNGDGTYSTGLTMTNTYPTSVSISPAGGYYIATYWGQLTYYLSASGCTEVDIGTQSLHRDDGRTGDVTVDNSSAPYALRRRSLPARRCPSVLRPAAPARCSMDR